MDIGGGLSRMKETLLQKEMKKIDWIVPWLSGGE